MTTMKENEMKIPMKVPMNDYEILTSLGNLENLNLNQTQVTKLQTCNFYNNSEYKLICKITTLLRYRTEMIDMDESTMEIYRKILSLLNTMFIQTTLTDFMNSRISSFRKLIELMEPLQIQCIYMPLIEKSYTDELVYWQETQQALKQPRLEVNDDEQSALQIAFGIPILGNRNKNEISKLLQIPLQKLWYPVDMEAYKNIRSIMWGLLYNYNISVIFDSEVRKSTNINFSQTSLSLLSGIVLDHISQANVSQNLSDSFTLKFPSDGSKTAELILKLLQSLVNTTPYQLEEIDNKIIEILAKELNVDINELQELPDLKVTAFTPALKCITNFDRNVIYKVLSKYPSLTAGTNIILFDVCHIQAKQILATFRYYKNQEIYIESNQIQFKPLGVTLPNVTVNQRSQFQGLKQLIAFDNNYRKFQSIIQAFDISTNDVLALSAYIYNSAGISCTVIAAELYAYHFGLSTSQSMNMYSLLSKLTPTDINNLDELNRSTCRYERSIKNPLYTLLNINSNKSPLPPIDVKIVGDLVMNKMMKLQTMGEKIELASSINMHEYSIIYYLVNEYYRQSASKGKPPNRQQEINVKLLLLYSNTSDDVKTWIYETLMEPKTIMRSIQSNNLFKNSVNTTAKLPSKYAFKLYSSLLQNRIDIKENLCDLLEYVKKTKDYDMLNLLNIVAETIEYSVGEQQDNENNN